jgi:hypothetical protein
VIILPSYHFKGVIAGVIFSDSLTPTFPTNSTIFSTVILSKSKVSTLSSSVSGQPLLQSKTNRRHSGSLKKIPYSLFAGTDKSLIQSTRQTSTMSPGEENANKALTDRF